MNIYPTSIGPLSFCSFEEIFATLSTTDLLLLTTNWLKRLPTFCKAHAHCETFSKRLEEEKWDFTIVLLPGKLPKLKGALISLKTKIRLESTVYKDIRGRLPGANRMSPQIILELITCPNQTRSRERIPSLKRIKFFIKFQASHYPHWGFLIAIKIRDQAKV